MGSRATLGVAHLGDRAGIMGAVAVELDSFVFSIQEYRVAAAALQLIAPRARAWDSPAEDRSYVLD